MLGLKSESHPLKKGSVSYESSVTLIGVTYNMFEHSHDAHQIFTSGHKISSEANQMSHLEVPENGRFGNQEHAKRCYDLPKGSIVENVGFANSIPSRALY